MKLYDFMIKQIRVKSIKDVLVLLFKLAIIIVIADRAYEAIRFLICLFLQSARTIWLWPFSRIVLDKLNVLKPGYDSHPPRIQFAWTDEENKKWLQYLNLRYPEYRQKRSQTYHSIDAQEYFSNPRYAPTIYYSIFRVKCKSYKESIIRLNKARSPKERYRAASFNLSDISGCDRYKIQKTFEVVNSERKRFGMKGSY